jgi:hypothetical protein
MDLVKAVSIEIADGYSQRHVIVYSKKVLAGNLMARY